MSDSKIIVALDYPDAKSAMNIVENLDPRLCKLKVGKELFTREGPDMVRQLVKLNYDIFLDLKYHDIPNTVAKATLAAAELGVWMVNVHAQGGRKMLESAKKELINNNHSTLLIAVTVLTSLSPEEIIEVGINATPAEQVLRLAKLSADTGLDGVVCSPLEIETLRHNLDPGFKLITPGIRPAGSAADDQKRIMTPATALKAGSDYLVIGRPITQAADPIASLNKINDSLSSG